MLAVQNPTMGSSRPPNLDMPFGYSFDANSNFPLPSPTAPAPGPSLLDDSEAKYLESFFDGVSNEQFNFDNMFMNGRDGSELGMGWDEIPPAFMGTTSSYGQQPLMGNQGMPGQIFGNMHNQMNSAPIMPPSTSADVLEAATLLQNGSTGQSHSMAAGGLFGVHGISSSQMNGAPRPQSISQYPLARPPSHGLPQRAAGEEFYKNSYYSDMVFGADPAEGVRRRQGLQRNIEIQWGSDTRFTSSQGFASSDHQNMIAEAERSHLSIVDNVFRLDVSNANSSAENTQPSSPAHTRTKSSLTNGDDDDSRPRKRRKSKFQEDHDDDEDDEDEEDAKPPRLAISKTTKKRKPIKKASASADDSPTLDNADSSHKRRKSAAATAAANKAARENLTEEQKRENHIKSEQKRRALIKDGFDDLHELVPNLKGGGFSKSAVLIMAADWLETLLRGNEELRRRAEEMEGMS